MAEDAARALSPSESFVQTLETHAHVERTRKVGREGHATTMGV